MKLETLLCEAKFEDYMIYVDMDGVVADFEAAVKDKLGINMTDRKQLWKKIKHYNDTVNGWFYSLPMMSDANQLWDFVTSNFSNVEILTASGSTPKDAAGQKRAWIGDHFGYDINVHVVGAASEKAAFAHDKALLIDDRGKAIDPFAAAGGLTILHTSAANTISELKKFMEEWS